MKSIRDFKNYHKNTVRKIFIKIFQQSKKGEYNIFNNIENDDIQNLNHAPFLSQDEKNSQNVSLNNLKKKDIREIKVRYNIGNQRSSGFIYNKNIEKKSSFNSINSPNIKNKNYSNYFNINNYIKNIKTQSSNKAPNFLKKINFVYERNTHKHINAYNKSDLSMTRQITSDKNYRNILSNKEEGLKNKGRMPKPFNSNLNRYTFNHFRNGRISLKKNITEVKAMGISDNKHFKNKKKNSYIDNINNNAKMDDFIIINKSIDPERLLKNNNTINNDIISVNNGRIINLSNSINFSYTTGKFNCYYESRRTPPNLEKNKERNNTKNNKNIKININDYINKTNDEKEVKKINNNLNKNFNQILFNKKDLKKERNKYPLRLNFTKKIIENLNNSLESKSSINYNNEKKLGKDKANENISERAQKNIVKKDLLNFLNKDGNFQTKNNKAIEKIKKTDKQNKINKDEKEDNLISKKTKKNNIFYTTTNNSLTFNPVKNLKKCNYILKIKNNERFVVLNNGNHNKINSKKINIIPKIKNDRTYKISSHVVNEHFKDNSSEKEINSDDENISQMSMETLNDSIIMQIANRLINDEETLDRKEIIEILNCKKAKIKS